MGLYRDNGQENGSYYLGFRLLVPLMNIVNSPSGKAKLSFPSPTSPILIRKPSYPKLNQWVLSAHIMDTCQNLKGSSYYNNHAFYNDASIGYCGLCG